MYISAPFFRRSKNPLLLLMSALFLTACRTNPYSEPLSERAIAEANQVVSLAQSSGSAIVVRVSLDGQFCDRGELQLHQAQDRRIIDGSEVVIGQTGYNGKLSNFFDVEFYKKTFSAENIANAFSGKYGATGNDIRTSFRAIRPGEYYITNVTCEIGKKYVVVGSSASGFIFPGPTAPTLGDNFISIKSGQIIDAGVINIVTLQRQFFFFKGKAYLSGQKAPHLFRNILKNTLPDLEAKITYTKFSTAPAL